MDVMFGVERQGERGFFDAQKQVHGHMYSQSSRFFDVGLRSSDASIYLVKRLEPIHRCLIGWHRSQAFVAPQISGGILKLERVDGMPLLLQPVRASCNPEGCGHVFHATILLYIYTVYCEVFGYLFEGKELPSKEEVKYTRRVGELVYMACIHDPRQVVVR